MAVKRGPTIPAPFHLASDARAKFRQVQTEVTAPQQPVNEAPQVLRLSLTFGSGYE